MIANLPTSDRTAIERIVSQLQAAWNAGDGIAFGAPFADDADFVTIRGEHMQGRTAIAGGHAGIFRTIYAGSVNRLNIEAARLLRPDVALVHVHSVLDAPHGPLKGRHGARFSMVLTNDRGDWKIAAFQNTVEAEQQPPR